MQGNKVLLVEIESVDAKTLRQLVEDLTAQLDSGVIGLATVSEGKVSIVVGATGASIKQCGADKVVQQLAAELQGKGGGRPELAQVGAATPERLSAALRKVQAWLLVELG